MPTALQPKIWSVEEFERLDPDCRYDLIKGELRPMPPEPGWEHGVVTNDISLDLGLYVRQHDLGQCLAAETRFVIRRNPDTAIGPDWAFVRKERLPEHPIKGFCPFAPDAVLEVVSPSDRPSEVSAKVTQWLDAGVILVFVLNPATKRLTSHRLDRSPRVFGPNDELDGEEVLPGLLLPLKRILL